MKRSGTGDTEIDIPIWIGTCRKSNHRDCAFNQADGLEEREITTTESSEGPKPEEVDGVDKEDLGGVGVRHRRHDDGLNENRVSALRAELITRDSEREIHGEG